MSRAPFEPGIAGAILSVLDDPILALALARQIDREQGKGTTANLQEAAIAILSCETTKGEPINDHRPASAA